MTVVQAGTSSGAGKRAARTSRANALMAATAAAAPFMYRRANRGWKSGSNPNRSNSTSTWPEVCSPAPMQYAVVAALTGDRSHQARFRRALAERARITADSLNAIPGMRCVLPRAAFYAMPALTLPPGRTDEDYVLALLGATGILCVYGSGFGMRPEEGTFRIVFLASPDELRTIYADIGAFTREYLAR